MTTLAAGQILQNRYRIDRPLGNSAGGGGVYSAWDTSLNMPVAVKEQAGGSDAAMRLFTLQARALANLRHPGLPHIIDYFSTQAGSPGIEGNCRYLVMEFIEGPSLHELLIERGGPLPEGQALAWIDAVCAALAYLHAQTPPIIHRDIKPANIRIGSQGRVALVDYGIELPADEDLQAAVVAGMPQDGRGRSPYAAPELFYGMATPASDIYSLGATLYAVLTGRPPVDAPRRQMGAALHAPRQLNPAIPPRVEAIILCALELDPARRFSSAGELRRSMRESAPVAQTIVRPMTPPTERVALHQAWPGAVPAEAPAVELPRDEPFELDGPSGPAGLAGRRWLLPAAGILFGLLCLLVGVAGGAGLYWFALSPTATLPAAVLVGVSAVPSTATPVGIVLVPTDTLTVVDAATQGPLPTPGPTFTSWPTSTFSGGPVATATSPRPESSPTPGIKPTWQPCPGIYASRLYVGDNAYVSYDPPRPNRVRRRPDTGAEVLGFIQPGEKVEITGGPACANQFVWWEVRSLSSGLSGWTAEGDSSAYWLAPLN